MPLTTGRYALGPADGDLLIRTGREGPAALMGHDLTLVAKRWSATVEVDAEEPSRSRVKATVDAASLTVREASGGPVGLTESQRAEIEDNVRSKVLLSDRFPRITFSSIAVETTGRRTSVSGNLTILRRTRPAVLALRVARSRVPRIVATTSVTQTDFGIEPYSALLGALRVKDVVEVSIEVRLRPGPG
ncbi:MAG: YceI family protein [Candidatus Dormibacteraeota bacterium]|nr:YceI family protein [Candidatus Dormibacteraeota bacterium]